MIRTIIVIAVAGVVLAAGASDVAAQRSAQNVAKLSSQLRSGDAKKATAAAKSLASIKAPAALEALLDGLAVGLPSPAAAAALDAVGNKGAVKALDTVTHYLSHRSVKVRIAAVGAAGALPDKRAAAKVILALRDADKDVRAKAASLVAKNKWKGGINPLVALLKRGDDAAAPALAALANPALARSIAELIGSAPDGLLARCLGGIVVRPDFKPEEARVEVVRALGRIPGADSLEQLTNYVGSLPETSRRLSKREAQSIIDQRLGGD